MSSATVVGAGVSGASTARELARRGWDVTLVEQYAPGTVRSASGGDTRLLRAGARARRLVRASSPGGRARPGSSSGGDGHAHLRAGRHRVVRAAGRRLRGSQPRVAAAARHPLRVALAGRRAAPVPVARRRRPARRAARAGCRRPARAAGDAAARRGRRPLGCAHAAAAVTPADAAHSDVVVWACGAWLPALFPERSRAEDLAARRLLLRRRRRLAGHARLLRVRPRVLRPRRARRARREDRARLRRRRRSTRTRSTAGRHGSWSTRRVPTRPRGSPSSRRRRSSADAYASTT